MDTFFLMIPSIFRCNSGIFDDDLEGARAINSADASEKAHFHEIWMFTNIRRKNMQQQRDEHRRSGGEEKKSQAKTKTLEFM